MAYQRVIQALADPTRRMIFERLRRGPLPVRRLAEGLEVTRPAVSQHLKVLVGAGLVHVRRQGTSRIYGVEIQGLGELRQYLDRLWDDVLGAFEVEANRESPAKGTQGTKRTKGKKGKSPCSTSCGGSSRMGGGGCMPSLSTVRATSS